MAKAFEKPAYQPRVSRKLHSFLKKEGRSKATLKDMQKSLSGIGVSLSKRVSEEREQ